MRRKLCRFRHACFIAELGTHPVNDSDNGFLGFPRVQNVGDGLCHSLPGLGMPLSDRGRLLVVSYGCVAELGSVSGVDAGLELESEGMWVTLHDAVVDFARLVGPDS